jgi:hypothetical protein
MKHLLTAVCLFLISATPAWADIGKVSTQAGNAASIKRGAQVMPSRTNSAIRSNDVVSTQKGTSLQIAFVDRTNVRITENSRLVIDDFVYDPKRSDASKVGMRVSMGTVRYTSGQIAKVNPQRINIKTPSASIAVRGTDFHMTVDEAGRSLVILVPSCTDDNINITDDNKLVNCQTGKITVQNAAGTVELDQPYSATYVANFDSLPNPPIVVKLTTVDPRISFDSQVTNDLIISPPEAIQEQLAQSNKDNNAEEQEEEFASRTANAENNRSQQQKETTVVSVTTDVSNRGPCSDKIICVEMNPFVTFYRTTDSDNYAEVRARLNSNLSLTITHNGDEGKLGWGAAPNSGNTVTVRQSQ